MSERNDLEKLMIGNKPVFCSLCNGKMYYVQNGMYNCETCGHEELDDFGKVKRFLEENGPSSSMVVSMGTGVKPEIIELFLKEGRIEIPEGSKYYLQCERCGCSIRYGRYCPSCVKELCGGIQSLFNKDIGEKPRFESNSDMKGKMHFLNKNIF